MACFSVRRRWLNGELLHWFASLHFVVQNTSPGTTTMVASISGWRFFQTCSIHVWEILPKGWSLTAVLSGPVHYAYTTLIGLWDVRKGPAAELANQGSSNVKPRLMRRSLGPLGNLVPADVALLKFPAQPFQETLSWQGCAGVWEEA